eukprot:TRINITY_DN347_c0_g2_i3.p1 TRINITY_DN347_c0_g2~~TRINITY_DN347_c0_g2_i3.p1  ORF type:complete len:291 (-),score=51.07 TRINITY_DN347_c0_g2_i3:268-1140(-)
MQSTGVVISSITFLNSPFWTVHPVYCSHVYIHNITILAPLDSPNTDGVDPDSSNDVCIEDCYISTGDDLISIKSGWDEYGISYARPSTNIIIRRVTGETKLAAGIALGSEMSGGISEVHAENLQLFNSPSGIRIKTSSGRGGYIRNVEFSNVIMTNVEVAIRFTAQFGEHPDEDYDPNALPDIHSITFKDISGTNISTAGLLQGIEGDDFFNICLSNITFNVTSDPWNCSYIEGFSESVSPEPCKALEERIPKDSPACYSSNLSQPISSEGNFLVSTILRLSSIYSSMLR